MNYEYTDKMVTPWGRMKEMKELINKTSIREKLAELQLPEGKNNNCLDTVGILKSFWVNIWIGLLSVITGRINNTCTADGAKRVYYCNQTE